MSDDLFELFEKDDEEKRRGRKHHAHQKHRSHHDDDDDGGATLSERWDRVSKNKWLLAGIIIGGIVLIAVAIYTIILLLPLAAEYWASEPVQNGAEIAKAANTLVGE